MDFFDRQDRARRHTKRLVFYFALALVFTVAAVYLAFALAFRFRPEHGDALSQLWDPTLFAGVAAGTSFVIFLGSLVKIMELSRGGSAVAAMLGGTPVNPNTTDPDERKLLNVVEEMALASGVPMPQVFLLRDEEGINAFAAGLKTQEAAVGVTRGCIQRLNRDELQGVIAHEFSHILNGDMRLNLRLIGIVNGLLVLAIIGRQLLYVRSSGRSRDGKGGNPLPLIGLALVIIGGIGMFFGRLIKSAVSRQREFLADAAAVQFTRNPAGLAGALKKIGGLAAGSRLETPKAEQASHLFFSNGLAESWFSLFSTHPPLAERIRALDPQFDGEFPRDDGRMRPPLLDRGYAYDEAEAAGVGASDVAGQQVPLPALRPAAAVAATAMMAQAGTPTPHHLRYAVALRERLPAELREAAHEPLSAAGLVLSLVLSRDAALRQQQLDSLETLVREQFLAGLPKITAAVAAIEARDRLPLAMLALPALGQLSPAQFHGFSQLLQQLVESDQEIDLFEYTLQRLVRRHLAPHYETTARPVTQFYSLKPLLPDCAVVLSALARQGNENEPATVEAFAQGATLLDPTGGRLALLAPERCDLAPIDAALERLALASPSIKRQVLQACAATVAADGQIAAREAELLRAIADSLDCPIPPFIEGV